MRICVMGTDSTYIGDTTRFRDHTNANRKEVCKRVRQVTGLKFTQVNPSCGLTTAIEKEMDLWERETFASCATEEKRLSRQP